MIEVKTISHSIGTNQILNDVSINISNGEVITILGPNGAGKSTLLKCLSGGIVANKGFVKMDGKLLQDYSAKELAKKRAVLSQNSLVNFPFTVIEITLMGRNPYMVSGESKEDILIAQEALEMLDVIHLKDRIFPTLSGGEQQRVHIARILAQIWQQQNSYLFLDEPTSALDLKHQHQLLELLRELTQKNISSICVMHDLHLAKQYSDKVLLMREGKMFAFGNVKDVLNCETVACVYDISLDKVFL